MHGYSVKDTTEKMSDNIWSGTDYLGNITGVSCKQENVKVTSSTEWSVNGNRSWKYVRQDYEGGGFTWARWTSLTDDFQQGDSYKLSLKLLLIQGKIDIWLDEGSDDTLKESVRCTAQEGVQDIYLTRTITSEELSTMSVRINAVDDGTMAYIDNMSIIEV